MSGKIVLTKRGEAALGWLGGLIFAGIIAGCMALEAFL